MSRGDPLPIVSAENFATEPAAGRLRPSKPYPLRGRTYATLLGLIAATGLRVSEALNLRMGDVLPDGVLSIRRTKFAKSRLVPLHTTVADALDRYLQVRGRLAVTDDHVFLSASGRRISASMVNYTFRRILRLAAIVDDQVISSQGISLVGAGQHIIGIVDGHIR